MTKSCWLLRIQDYFSIMVLFLGHLRKKWRIECAGIISVFLMMVLGVLLPAITSALFGFHGDFVEVAFTYSSFATILIAILVIVNADLTTSRIIYEARYSYRLWRFMFSCYHNIVREYLKFAKANGIPRESIIMEHDRTIVSTIFLRIFTMYFYNMDVKMKNPEPYLIDIKEMSDLYNAKSFNDIYSKIFFQPELKNGNAPYAQVVIDILDDVLTKLYSKPWFVDYYNEKIVFNMVQHILTNWYGNIVPFRSCQPLAM